ncbi:MAG TPA: Gfo/Idh/MocA family oxidoreductase [Kofleriaceae bacterium]|jgi:predicted dehydrogenase|nr:Gfo/Idh/MocA family oxidoreductase [Kofleriaceae bacterium]
MIARPRLGFLGVGWIGRHRLEAIARNGCADIVAIADPSPERRDAALAVAPAATPCEHLGQLLEQPLDGIVIATPSALHAEHCLAALGHGLAVFCQKPLGRTAAETEQLVAAARDANCLLAVDLSYRHTAAIQRIREVLRTGGIGQVFAVDLVFHNAYGPDAAWFYDKAASGGGCVIDLGIHLVDLALWLLEFPAVEAVDSRLYRRGVPLSAGDSRVEDFAAVQLRLAGGVIVRLACSWRVSAGRDAVIEATCYGADGGLAMKNVDGSFYDLVAERYRGTRGERLVSPPDDWGGRAALDWALRLARESGFDPEAERLVDVARVLDAIYQGGVR